MRLEPYLVIFVAGLAVLMPATEVHPQDSTPHELPSASKWILESRDSITVAAGLKPLASSPLEAGEKEIRIWIGEGLGIPENLYRIVQRKDRVTGELIFFWNLGYRGGADPGEPDFNAVMLYSLAGQCTTVGRSGNAHACHARLMTEPDWKSILARMERSQLWTLPDEKELPPDSFVTFDGWGMVVEIRDGDHYRAYHYSNPDAHQHPASVRAANIAGVARSLDAFLAPAENRRRYRGLLTLNLPHWEFTPCGETQPWRAEGSIGNLAMTTGSVTRLYIEARGLREYPGLTRFYSDYDDGIHIDTIYVHRQWDPKDCQ